MVFYGLDKNKLAFDAQHETVICFLFIYLLSGFGLDHKNVGFGPIPEL